MNQPLPWLLFPLLATLPQDEHASDAPPFGQAELEALVAELGRVVPENPEYHYPLEARMVEDPVENAFAGYEERDDVKQTFVQMNRGLVDLVHGDRRILRACVAHELAHLACGHSLTNPGDRDTDNVYTRQEEWEADRLGVAYLEQIGGSAEDMVELLLALDRMAKARQYPWIVLVAGDHGSAMYRAARISRGEALLRAVSRFEIGLMYMDCRRFDAAIQYFDQALAIEPALDEACLNAASAALQEYFDRLPARVQDEWLRPEFGPLLTDTQLMRGRAIQIGAEDRLRYVRALARIAAIPEGANAAMRRFLSATARVLEPDGKEETLRAGVEELERLLADTPDSELWQVKSYRLRVANNLALGLARLDESGRALGILVNELAADPSFVVSAAENLARLPLSGMLSTEQAIAVANALVAFLQSTPESAPGAKEVERALDQILAEHSLAGNWSLPPRPIALCAAISLFLGEEEIGLFEEFSKVSGAFGDLPSAGLIDEKYPDLRFLYWGDEPTSAEILALAEGDELVKLTSYRRDTKLALRPTRESGLQTVLSVQVGMSSEELDALLQPAGDWAQSDDYALLDRQSFLTEPPGDGFKLWRYYPMLDFGVLLEEGRVVAISVTPVRG